MKIGKLLRNDKFYYFLVILSLIYSFSVTKLYKFESKYTADNNIFTGIIIEKEFDGNKLSFTIKANDLGKFQELLEKDLADFSSSFINISRISLVGYGIMNNKDIIKKTLDILNINSVDIFSLKLEECRLSIMTKEKVSDKLLEQLHHELIN